jgi:Cu2+-exporting ATPase
MTENMQKDTGGTGAAGTEDRRHDGRAAAQQSEHSVAPHETHSHQVHEAHEEHMSQPAHAGHQEHEAHEEQMSQRAHAGHQEHEAHEEHMGYPAHAGHQEHEAHEEHMSHPAHAGHQEHEAHEAHMSQPAHAGHQEHEAHEAHEGHEDHAGHQDHTGHEAMFRQRFWIVLAISIPVLIFSPAIQGFFGYSTPDFPGSGLIVPVLGVVIFIYGGLPFLRMAVPEVRTRAPGMMTLISLAISVAFIYSIAASIFDLGEPFYWELVTLIGIMLLGHWMEMRSVRQATGALDELAKLMPDTAERIKADGQTEKVKVSQVRADDMVLVRPGDSIPADGRVVEGKSEVNESMITGESKPVKKEPESQVIGGTVNSGSGSLRIRVTATGDDTALSGIMRLVKEAQSSKSRTQLLADRAAGILFYAALGAAFVTLVIWTIAVGFNNETLGRVVTVLVIACPHALGLAVPLVVAITTATSANNGILVRDRRAMESARQIDVVIFDKTGTLTKGQQGLVDMAADGIASAEALALAAAIEGDSEHIIARAIVEDARNKGLDIPQITEFEAMKGRGVRASYQGQHVYVGGPRLLETLEPQVPESISGFTADAGKKGQTVVYLVRKDQVLAAFALADVIREESRTAVKALHAMGVQVAMLTGDSEAVAKAVADELEVDTYFAQVLPEDKDKKVQELQDRGKRVAMVGDGVNDAPALTRADVGIAIGSGTDVAVESAGLILIKSNPLDVVKIVKISQASYRKMKQNIWWAAGYNIIAIPLAAGVLAPIGFIMPPAVGALLMSLSTVIVAINAQTLRRLSL